MAYKASASILQFFYFNSKITFQLMFLELREKYDVEKPTAFEDCILSQVGFDCCLRKDSTLLFKTGKATQFAVS